MASSDLNSQDLELGSFQSLFDETVRRWSRDGNVRRLWDRDASLWSGADESEWLGWLDVVPRQIEASAELTVIANDVATSDVQDVVVLGMGGSSLFPEVLARTFEPASGFPSLRILDSTVPAQVLALRNALDLDRTLFVVASKSGTTAEPLAFESYFYDALGDGSRFLAVTDPGTPLEAAARERGYRHVFHGEPAIGGRFSALSSFGMVPAALGGLDVLDLLERARVMADACGPDVASAENPGVSLGIALGVLARAGRDKLTLVASPEIEALGAWIEQLVAESTGKHGKGIVPVDREPVGASDAYGDDRMFVAIGYGDDRPRLPEGHPVIRIRVGHRADLTQEIFRWEMATAVAGAVLELNPFDQPDVEASKGKTRELIARYEANGETGDGDAAPFPDEGRLRAHLETLAPSDYFGVAAYIERNDATDERLQAIRTRVRDRRHVATTVGFGPRFLHSTGQLYKGGPNRGVFLQITADDVQDVAIPGQRVTFGTLERFQAEGDLSVLLERGRRVLRVPLGEDVLGGLDRLLAIC